MIPAQPLWSVLQETDLRFEETDQAVGTLLSVSKDKGIVRYSDLFPDRAIRAENHDRYKFVKSGSIVLNKMSASSGAVGVAKEAGIVSPDYAVLETKSFNNERFINYILGSADFCKNKVGPILRGIGTGDATSVRTPRVGMREYLSLLIPVPPLETQQRIADYLDRETAEIDAAVADLDRYVELLEKRLELSVAKMLEKDQHPSVPLFTMCDFSSGGGIPRDELHESGEYPVYGGNGIMGYSKQYNQSVDSIVVGRVGALCGNVHLAKAPFFVTDNAMVVSLKEAVSLDWLVFALRDLRLRELSQSSAQPVITSTKVSRQRVSRPSFSRQSQIADSILNEASEVNALIADSINLRDLLIRRRSVLISDVVTGRKQV